jgi:hypothetical protein
METVVALRVEMARVAVVTAVTAVMVETAAAAMTEATMVTAPT